MGSYRKDAATEGNAPHLSANRRDVLKLGLGSLGLARLTAAGAASRSPGRASIPAPAAARSVRA